jgi:hypothetical protein
LSVAVIWRWRAVFSSGVFGEWRRLWRSSINWARRKSVVSCGAILGTVLIQLYVAIPD